MERKMNIPTDHLPVNVADMVRDGNGYSVDLWRQASQDWSHVYKGMVVAMLAEGEESRAKNFSEQENAIMMRDVASSDMLLAAICHLSDDALRRLYEAIDGEQILRKFDNDLQAKVVANLGKLV